MQKSQVASLGHFENGQKVSIAVELEVGSFHDPAPGFGIRVAIFDEPLFGA